MVVGGSRGVCSGASVTLQCTLTGNLLLWKKPDGDINLVRGLHTTWSGSGTYQWELVELDDTHLQSSLTFTFSNQITINCTNVAYTSSITIHIEGNTSSIT